MDFGYGIEIEGVGSNNLHENGNLYVTDRVYRSLSDQSPFQPPNLDKFWTLKPDLLPVTDSKSDKATPFDHKMESSSFDFKFRYSKHIAEEFGWTNQKTGIELDTVMSLNANIINTDTDGLIDGLNQRVLWIDNEAILIDDALRTFLSSDSYNISSRGYYNTAQTEHREGKNVYKDSNPDLANRRVKLYKIYIPTGKVKQKWVGFIEDEEDFSPSTNENGTKFTLPTSSISAYRKNWTINKEKSTYDLSSGDAPFGLTIKLIDTSLQGLDGDPPESSSILSDNFYQDNNRRSWYKYTPEESSTIENKILIGTSTEMLLKNRLDSQVGTKGRNNIDEIQKIVDTGEIKEVAVISPELDMKINGAPNPTPEAQNYSDTDWWSTTWPIKQMGNDSYFSGRRHNEFFDAPLYAPYHPLVIDACMCLSTESNIKRPTEFDIFSGDWALNLRWMFAGDDAIEAIKDVVKLVNKYPSYISDRLIIGWEQNEINWMKWSEKNLLYPNGFQRIIKEDGSLSWAHISETDIEEYSDNLKQTRPKPITNSGNEPGRMKWIKSENNKTSKIQSTYNNLPWLPERKETTISDEVDISRATKKTSSTTELSLDYISSRNKVQRKSLSKLSFEIFDNPAIEVKVRSPEVVNSQSNAPDDINYDIGNNILLDSLNVENAWAINTDGEVVEEIDTSPQWHGKIIKRKWNPENDTYILRIVLLNHLNNRVIRDKGTNDIIYEIDNSESRIYTSEFEEIYGVFWPLSYFFIGDEVEIHAQNGEILNGVSHEIIEKGIDQAPSGTYRPYLVFEDSTGFADYSKGNVVRLSRMSFFNNNRNGDLHPSITRPNAYLASDGGFLRAGSILFSEIADRYG